MKITEELKKEVSELSDVKREKILKIGKYYMLLLAVVAVPIFAYMVKNVLEMLDVAKNHMRVNVFVKRNLIAFGFFTIYTVASHIFVKVKFPFYSDKKYRCIKKNIV